MAEELRWHLLRVNDTDGGAADNVVNFQNSTSQDLFIRVLRVAHHYDGAADTADGNSVMELSKAPAFQAGTNGSTIFTYITRACIGDIGATEQSAVAVHDTMRFAKGELTLEPNEALYVNQSITAISATTEYTALIGYHF